jgi:hypothetical protein
MVDATEAADAADMRAVFGTAVAVAPEPDAGDDATDADAAADTDAE